MILHLLLIGLACILQVCSIVGMELDQMNPNLRHEYAVRGMMMRGESAEGVRFISGANLDLDEEHDNDEQEEAGYFYLNYIFISVDDGTSSNGLSSQKHRYLRGNSSGSTFSEHSETKVGIHTSASNQIHSSSTSVVGTNAKNEEQDIGEDKDPEDGEEEEEEDPEVKPDAITFVQRIENAVHHTIGTPVELFEATKSFEPDLPKLSSFLKFVGSSLLFIMQ